MTESRPRFPGMSGNGGYERKSLHQAADEAPSFKLQAPEKSQTSNPKTGSEVVRWGCMEAGVVDWLPLSLLPLVVIAIRTVLPAWVFMWAMAFAIFIGCKWLTWRRACRK